VTCLLPACCLRQLPAACCQRFVDRHVRSTPQVANPLLHRRAAALVRRALPRGRLGLLEGNRVAAAGELGLVRAVIARDVFIAHLHDGTEPLIEVGGDAQVVTRDVGDALLGEAGGLHQRRQARAGVHLQPRGLARHRRCIGLGRREALHLRQLELTIDHQLHASPHRLGTRRYLDEAETNRGLDVGERERGAIDAS